MEWLFLKPFTHFYKQCRNDLFQQIYLLFGHATQKKFLQRNRSLVGKNVVAVVAFEQPEVLGWLIKLFKKNIANWEIVIFDNSRNATLRHEIADLCEALNVPYLALPKNITTHPNRSHGMAMNWIFYRIIKQLRPGKFGYLDHDMLPLKSAGDSIAKMLDSQNCYGLLKKKGAYWNLWAGYSFYRYADLENYSPNFLYDFTCGLDTGGRNWGSIYKYWDATTWQFVSNKEFFLTLSTGVNKKVNVIDGWVHIGAISYKDTLNDTHAFYEQLVFDIDSNLALDVAAVS